jgi:hypothetical protein
MKLCFKDVIMVLKYFFCKMVQTFLESYIKHYFIISKFSHQMTRMRFLYSPSYFFFSFLFLNVLCLISKVKTLKHTLFYYSDCFQYFLYQIFVISFYIFTVFELLSRISIILQYWMQYWIVYYLIGHISYLRRWLAYKTNVKLHIVQICINVTYYCVQ